MVAAVTPLPLGERGGPARTSAWEGEGTAPLIHIANHLALSLSCYAWGPPSPEVGEGK